MAEAAGPRRRFRLREEELACVLKTKSLSRAERDDSADGVVWGDADGNAVAGNDLDAEAPHPTTQLRENLMSCVALDAV